MGKADLVPGFASLLYMSSQTARLSVSLRKWLGWLEQDLAVYGHTAKVVLTAVSFRLLLRLEFLRWLDFGGRLLVGFAIRSCHSFSRPDVVRSNMLRQPFQSWLH